MLEPRPLSRVALAALASLFALTASGPAAAAPAYVRSIVGAPWGSTTNEQALDLVYGFGGWDDLRYETVDAAALFSPTYHFIYLEGSDSNASELAAFLTANQALVEAWVFAGGRLFLNSAPNEGGNQAWGFGGVSLNYPEFPTDPGGAVDPAHPIWNGPFLPASTSFTGGSYAHATVTGPGLVALIVDSDGGNPNLAELPFGAGTAVFGGLTTSDFWEPNPDALNIRANVIAYLDGLDGADTDGDGVADGADNCPFVSNPGQEDTNGDGTGDACSTVPGAYVRSEFAGSPWGSNTNELAMDAVYGVGGWDDLRFEFVDPAALFSDAYGFIYLEGSDANSEELGAFLSANQVALEGWVAGGGRLFLNNGPNEGGDQVWGFGGVGLTAFDFGDVGTAVDPSHPIWNGPFLPVSTEFTGSSYAHASISGAGLTQVMQDDNGGDPHAAETAWGAGLVFFGGLTTANFWAPQPDCQNLRANIIAYLANPDPDGDGIRDDDNCPLVANGGQEDADGDDIGDACDACPDDIENDADGDTVCESVDNCPVDANVDQADADGDEQGDACDACPNDAEDDVDGDSVCGDVDNCPADANADQADADDNGIGDACDEPVPTTTGGSSEGSSDGGSSEGGGSEGGSSEGGDTSGAGTAADTSGGADASASASAGTEGTDGDVESSGTGIDETDDDGGCNCNTTTTTPPWWMGLAAVVLRRRRRAARVG